MMFSKRKILNLFSIGLVSLVLAMPGALVRADECSQKSSSVAVGQSSVDARDIKIDFTITVYYPRACQTANHVSSMDVSLRAYDPDSDATGQKQINVNTVKVSFNGNDNILVKGSIAFFSMSAFTSSSHVGLLTRYVATGNEAINGYSSATQITTTAPPGPPPPPTNTTPPVPPGEPVPVDLHKQLLAGPGGTGEGGGSGFIQPVKGTFSSLLNRVVAFLVSFIAIMAIIFIIIGGFRLAFSQGNTEAVTAGRKTITWAIIGLVIALLSFAIIRILDSLLF
jgi:type IV secretion system pilin